MKSNLAHQSLPLAESLTAHLRVLVETATPDSGLYDQVLQEVEKPLLELCLQQCRGNQLRTAALLGLNRNTLRKKLRLLGITTRRGRR